MYPVLTPKSDSDKFLLEGVRRKIFWRLCMNTKTLINELSSPESKQQIEDLVRKNLETWNILINLIEKIDVSISVFNETRTHPDDITAGELPELTLNILKALYVEQPQKCSGDVWNIGNKIVIILYNIFKI